MADLPIARREFCTRQNPYGWPPAERMVQQDNDHDLPSTWNAYRQAYNEADGSRVEYCTLAGHEGEELADE